MKKTLLLILACSLIASQAMATHKVGIVMLPDQVRIEKSELFFNGAGIFSKSFMDLFVCALYLREKSRDATAIIHADKAMSMRFHITSDFVTREKLLESISSTALAQDTETDALLTVLNALAAMFQEEIHPGDIIETAYLPDQGIQVLRNDHYLGSIKGLDSKEELFALWLGKKPVDKSLKKSLLAAGIARE